MQISLGMQPITEKLDVGEQLSMDQLLEHLPALKEVPKSQVENWAKGAAVLRRFKAGDIVCEEGAYGSTAFYVVSGTVDIFIANTLAHVKGRAGRGLFSNIFARIKSTLVSDTEEKRDKPERKFIPIDATVDLNIKKPIAQLEAGELFGEMTCRTFQPRSATVRAANDCVMVEMLRVVLDMLMGTRTIDVETKAGTKVKAPTFKGTSFKTEMDRKYRERSLTSHLRGVPLLSTLDDEFLTYFKKTVVLASYGKGELICKQGEKADAFFLIRQGMVKVSQSMPGGEMVLTYLGRGDFFGEIGLLLDMPRAATCTALDSVDVVKISQADFDFMLTQFPEVRTKLMTVAEARMEAAEVKSVPAGLQLNDFINQGLFEAQNLLLIDLDRCTRCDQCVRACAEAHDGITRLLRDGLRYDKYLVATTCRTCRDPLCMTQCPVGSIRRKDSLEIIIEDWCIGCSKCAELCPYGNINMHPVELMVDVKTAQEAKPGPAGPSNDAPKDEKKRTVFKAATCDLCTEHATPSCVYACPHDAAKRVDPTEFFARSLAMGDISAAKRSKSVSIQKFDTRVTHRAESHDKQNP